MKGDRFPFTPSFRGDGKLTIAHIIALIFPLLTISNTNEAHDVLAQLMAEGARAGDSLL